MPATAPAPTSAAADAVLEGMYTSGLPAEVTAAVAEALPPSDPLDRPDFDAVDFINGRFPSEQAALEALEPFIAQVTGEIGALDTDISRAIEAQARAGEQATKDISEAQAAISELFEKIKDITAKAEQSELMVQEICRDIKQLDFAKRHLQTTITALKRLHMLVSAVDQLTFMASNRHYKEAANLVDAVRQLATHFEGYQQIPRIAEIRKTVEDINAQLNDQITKAFAEISEMSYNVAAPSQLRRDDAPSGSFKSLAEACLVVDALGPQARRVHVDDFCRRQLAPYGEAFPKGGEFSALEHIERRFAWFRRTLKSVDERFDAVFPKHWRVQHCLLMAFLQQTRQQILETLEGGGPESENVTVLLKALQKALLFEREMQPRFEQSQPRREELLGSPSAAGGTAPGGLPSPFQQQQQQQQKKEEDEGTSKFAALAKDGKAADGGKKLALDAADVLPIVGVVSGVFDPFMGPYIELEKRNMEEMMQKAMDEDQVDRNLNMAKLPVFTSSINVFVYIKNAIKRCTALTTAATFFTLSKEFKACLQNYAKQLRAKLPPPTNAAAIAAAQAAQQPAPLPLYRLGEGGEVDVCYLINTAEYCTDTVPQLEEMVRAKIDASYAESISFTAEVDAFDEAITAAVRVLLSALEARFEPGYKSLASFNWGACEGVGEESAYVRVINDAIRAYVPSVRALLSSVYFRNFCDKFAQSFLPNYLGAILRLKRINEMGTQQLLLDIYNLKTLMLQMPSIAQPSGEAPVAAPATYTKYVTKQFAKIEVVLKLVGTPVEMLAERFKIMWPDGEAQDLHAVMALKGMTRKEQQSVMAAVGLNDYAAGGDDQAGGAGSDGAGKGAAGGRAGQPSPSSGPGGAAAGGAAGGGGLTSPLGAIPGVVPLSANLASLNLNAATSAAGKGMKTVAEEMRKAFR